jgi:formate dehydrogenase subunit delta
MSAKKLVTMANQIGTFFTSQGSSQAVARTADHLKRFWDPRMRAEIIAHLHAGGEGLRPEVRVAVERLSAEAGEPVGAAAPT